MIFITYMRDEALGWILGKRCLAVFLHAHEKTFKIRMPNELFFILLSRDLSSSCGNDCFGECFSFDM